jgi:hypothetical protein
MFCAACSARAASASWATLEQTALMRRRFRRMYRLLTFLIARYVRATARVQDMVSPHGMRPHHHLLVCCTWWAATERDLWPPSDALDNCFASIAYIIAFRRWFRALVPASQCNATWYSHRFLIMWPERKPALSFRWCLVPMIRQYHGICAAETCHRQAGRSHASVTVFRRLVPGPCHSVH